MKQVEAGTTGTQKHRVTRFRHFMTGLNTVFHTVCILYRKAESIEVVMQFPVICTEIYKSTAFLLHEFFDWCVVVALVFAS